MARLIIRAIAPDGEEADIGPVFTMESALILADECEAAGWAVMGPPVPYMTAAAFRQKVKEEGRG